MQAGQIANQKLMTEKVMKIVEARQSEQVIRVSYIFVKICGEFTAVNLYVVLILKIVKCDCKAFHK